MQPLDYISLWLESVGFVFYSLAHNTWFWSLPSKHRHSKLCLLTFHVPQVHLGCIPAPPEGPRHQVTAAIGRLALHTLVGWMLDSYTLKRALSKTDHTGHWTEERFTWSAYGKWHSLQIFSGRLLCAVWASAEDANTTDCSSLGFAGTKRILLVGHHPLPQISETEINICLIKRETRFSSLEIQGFCHVRSRPSWIPPRRAMWWAWKCIWIYSCSQMFT